MNTSQRQEVAICINDQSFYLKAEQEDKKTHIIFGQDESAPASRHRKETVGP
jgi:hypothetical protein